MGKWGSCHSLATNYLDLRSSSNTFATSDYDHIIEQHNLRRHQNVNSEILKTVGGGRNGIEERRATDTERRNIVHAIVETGRSHAGLGELLAPLSKRDLRDHEVEHLATSILLYVAANVHEKGQGTLSERIRSSILCRPLLSRPLSG